MLNNIRIKFIRGEEVKFISHLDLMKVFERAARRANIPIAYSQGFNPRAHLIFGLPLSVGVTSQTEYADIELSERLEPDGFMEKINKELPKGLKVLEAKIKQTKENIMASISASAYEILISTSERTELAELENKIQIFLSKQEIVVKKEGKKGIKLLDIKTMIRDLKVKNMMNDFDNVEVKDFLQNFIEAQKDASLLRPSYSLENIFCLSALLSAGNVANLKPELLFAAFNEFANGSMKLVKIHRSGLFVEIGGILKNPMEASVLS